MNIYDAYCEHDEGNYQDYLTINELEDTAANREKYCMKDWLWFSEYEHLVNEEGPFNSDERRGVI